MTWEQVRDCIDIYTSIIHPIFGFLNIDLLQQRIKSYWERNPRELSTLEAVVSGIVGLASLYSNLLDQEKETQMILHAKSILEDPVLGRQLSQDLVAAWILRTIYIRATGRPLAAWLCSATTMHMVEITGLHQDPGSTSFASENADALDIRHRTASMAQTLHTMIAYDCGKTIIQLSNAADFRLQPRPGDFTPQLLNLVRMIPVAQAAVSDPITMHAEPTKAMENLNATAADHDFLILVKAELCFSIYRRLPPILHHGQVKLVLAAGVAALPAARRLATQEHPWWNTTNAVFQFICITLSINNTDSLAHIEAAMETLEAVAQRFNTHMTNEALHTAQSLVNALLQKKDQETPFLQRARRPLLQNATDESVEEWAPPPDVAGILDLYSAAPFLNLDMGLEL